MPDRKNSGICETEFNLERRHPMKQGAVNEEQCTTGMVFIANHRKQRTSRNVKNEFWVNGVHL